MRTDARPLVTLSVSSLHLTARFPPNANERSDTRSVGDLVLMGPGRTGAIFALLLLGTSHVARAQSTQPRESNAAWSRGSLTGRIVEATQQSPIRGATVDLTNSIVGTATLHATSMADGTFRFQGLRPGQYVARIRALGFAPRDLAAVRISEGAPTVDVGSVALTTVPLELQALAVTAVRPDVQLAPDRSTFVVRDMPATRGGTALDVLRNVPSVDVDIENNVSLRGNAAVVVQINGRPTPMKAAQLGNFLAQLPADLVDKVEVVPNPSAREDPTGVAGIINIVLKKETDGGSSGGLTMGGATTGHADLGANAGYQRGALSAYGSYGFFRDNRPRTETIFRENLYRDPLTYLAEDGARSQLQLGHTMTAHLGYRVRPRDETSLDVLFTTRRETEANSILYRNLDASRALAALADRTTSGTNDRYNVEVALDDKHSFRTKGHVLSGELRYATDQEAGPVSVVADTFALNRSSLGQTARESQASLERPQEFSAKLDYVRPLMRSLRFEAGYKGLLQRFHTTLDTRVFDPALATYRVDSSRVSNFTYDQHVEAAYLMLSGRAAKLLMQGGLRAERASTQFRLQTLNASFDNHYNSLFPSALVAYNIDDAHEVKLSYSTRIRRPDDTDLLDPTLHYADPLNVTRGNPHLRPEYIRALELGLQRSSEHLTIEVTPFLRHSVDAVRTIRTIDSAGVATRTFANIATNDWYGTDATVALTQSRLKGFASVSAFRQVSDASNVGAGISIRTFGWNARTNATWQLSPTMDVQALVFYRAAMTVEQGRASSQTRVNFAARKKVMDDRVSLTLRVIDPFNTSHESTTTIDPRFVQDSYRARAIRGVLLSCNWTFGKPLKVRNREPDDPSQGSGAGM